MIWRMWQSQRHLFVVQAFWLWWDKCTVWPTYRKCLSIIHTQYCVYKLVRLMPHNIVWGSVKIPDLRWKAISLNVFCFFFCCCCFYNWSACRLFNRFCYSVELQVTDLSRSMWSGEWVYWVKLMLVKLSLLSRLLRILLFCALLTNCHWLNAKWPNFWLERWKRLFKVAKEQISAKLATEEKHDEI